MGKAKNRNYKVPSSVPSGGDLSRWFREERALSQRALAEMLSLSQSFIAQVERGEYPLPVDYYKRIYKIATLEERQMILETVMGELEYFFQHSPK